ASAGSIAACRTTVRRADKPTTCILHEGISIDPSPSYPRRTMPLERAARPALPGRAPTGDAVVEGAVVAASMLAASRAPETLRKSRGAWSAFEAWASEQGVLALPASPAVVVSYLGHLHAEGLAPATLRLALSALADRHRATGHPSPRGPKVVDFL